MTCVLLAFTRSCPGRCRQPREGLEEAESANDLRREAESLVTFVLGDGDRGRRVDPDLRGLKTSSRRRSSVATPPAPAPAASRPWTSTSVPAFCDSGAASRPAPPADRPPPARAPLRLLEDAQLVRRREPTPRRLRHDLRVRRRRRRRPARCRPGVFRCLQPSGGGRLPSHRFSSGILHSTLASRPTLISLATAVAGPFGRQG